MLDRFNEKERKGKKNRNEGKKWRQGVQAIKLTPGLLSSSVAIRGRLLIDGRFIAVSPYIGLWSYAGRQKEGGRKGGRGDQWFSVRSVVGAHRVVRMLE